MFVESAGWPKTGGLWGIYYYTKDWAPIALEGERVSPGRMGLYDGDPSIDPRMRPRFDLELTAQGAVTGTWTSADGQQVLPVSLRRIAQPPPFDIAIQNPRRFADPRWPVEITYPEGWFFDVTGSALVLRSPDPKDMLFDNALQCERGRGVPRVPGEQEVPEPFEGGFYLTRSGWRVGGDPTPGPVCESFGCTVPKIRIVGSVTFLSADMGYRAYNPWGYAGAAEARQHLVIAGNEWVRCEDRLLDTEDRIQPRR